MVAPMAPPRPPPKIKPEKTRLFSSCMPGRLNFPFPAGAARFSVKLHKVCFHLTASPNCTLKQTTFYCVVKPACIFSSRAACSKQNTRYGIKRRHLNSGVCCKNINFHLPDYFTAAGAWSGMQSVTADTGTDYPAAFTFCPWRGAELQGPFPPSGRPGHPRLGGGAGGNDKQFRKAVLGQAVPHKRLHQDINPVPQ